MHAHRLLPVLAALLCLGLLAPPGFADPVDRRAATDFAAGWIASDIGEDGAVVSAWTGEPDVGLTVDAALGLAAAEREREAFDRAVAFVEDSYPDYVTDEDGDDQPGRLAKVALLAAAAGADPRAFGDEDLVERLEDTRVTAGDDAGMYGGVNLFASVTTTAFAALAVHAADGDVAGETLTWLADQQCPSGGWAGYRNPEERAAGTCDEANEDTNNTSLALQAAAATGAELPHDPVAFLLAARNDDGGFAYDPGDPTDTNSTALVVQALVALGEDPAGAPWVDERRDSAFTALTGFQLKCAADPDDRGAFAYQPDHDGDLFADGFATFQAVWGTAALPFPFGPRDVGDGAPALECPELDEARLAGEDRFTTAARIAGASYPTGAEVVVVANGFGFADALAGAPLAGALDAPILLTRPDVLPDSAAEAIDQLGAQEAVVLGGPAAVSDAVVDQLEALDSIEIVDRIAGENRFDTAARIGGRLPDDTAPAYVTQGQSPDPGAGWPDALAVAALAAFEGRPILLVTRDSVPDETRDALAGRGAPTIVGGPNAVSESVANEVGAAGRVAGENRYGTALAVSRLARDLGMDPADTWAATGLDFADALAAGPAVARRGGVLVLVHGHDATRSPATLRYLHEVNFEVAALTVVGGEAAVSPSVAAAMRAHVR